MSKLSSHIIRVGDTVVSCEKVNSVEFYHNEDGILIFKFTADNNSYESAIIINALTRMEERVVIEVIKKGFESEMMIDEIRKGKKKYKVFDFGVFVEDYLEIRKKLNYDMKEIMKHYEVAYLQEYLQDAYRQLEHLGPASNN